MSSQTITQLPFFFFFFFNDTATTEIYTLSLHDALPILWESAPREFHAGKSLPGTRRNRPLRDRKSTRLNSSHTVISYAVFCLKKKKNTNRQTATRPLPHEVDTGPAENHSQAALNALYTC